MWFNGINCFDCSAVALILLVLIIVYVSNAIITNDIDELTADNETVDRPLDEAGFLNLMAEIDWPINGKWEHEMRVGKVISKHIDSM